MNTYAYVGGNPINGIDPTGLDALVIIGGVRDGSLNIFGHVGMAITGSGMYSYGNSIGIGSSVAGCINSQSQVRNQMVTVVPTTAAQDAAMRAYVAQHSDENDVRKADNCALRPMRA